MSSAWGRWPRLPTDESVEPCTPVRPACSSWWTEPHEDDGTSGPSPVPESRSPRPAAGHPSSLGPSAAASRTAAARASSGVIPARPTSQVESGAAGRSDACAATPAIARRTSSSSSLGGAVPSASANCRTQSAAEIPEAELPDTLVTMTVYPFCPLRARRLGRDKCPAARGGALVPRRPPGQVGRLGARTYPVRSAVNHVRSHVRPGLAQRARRRPSTVTSEPPSRPSKRTATAPPLRLDGGSRASRSANARPRRRRGPYGGP